MRHATSHKENIHQYYVRTDGKILTGEATNKIALSIRGA